MHYFVAFLNAVRMAITAEEVLLCPPASSKPKINFLKKLPCGGTLPWVIYVQYVEKFKTNMK